jgi:hypothetical protein
MDFLSEPCTLIEVIINGRLIGLKGPVLEVLCLLPGFLVFLGDAVLFSG